LDGREGISPANRRAIAATLEAGVRIVLVTGRGADAPQRLVRELRLNVPSICAHGALTKDFLAGRTLGHIPVPLPYAVPMIEYAERNALPIAVYVEERFHRIAGSHSYVDDMRGPHWREVPSLLPLLSSAPTFIRFLGRESVEAMRAQFSEFPLHFKYEVWGEFEECAVTSLEATKKNALERLCADLGVAPENVLAVGDSRNDVPMMCWAGVGVAMGNAPADVIRAVGRVTATCEDDGVARAIERYVLAPLERSERSA
ncbi:MAG TPA: HAD hydrolase family protein, partial [Candidatus Acidoferrales bacterium]|nr:HAD hydrolase family protein [Candidatus Acidoferrales bacterium]